MPDFLDWRDVEFDPALFGRKLQGVGQQVHQDLLDAQGIADIDLLKERRGKQVEYYAYAQWPAGTSEKGFAA